MEIATVVGIWAAPNIIDALIWAAFGVINLWIWQKNKAQGNLLMLCGAAAIVLGRLSMAFSGERSMPSEFLVMWVPLLGAAAILVGFFTLSKPLIEAQMAALKTKMESLKDATSEKQAEGDEKQDAGSDA